MSREPRTPPAGSVTGLLQAWGQGDLQARDELVRVVYDELRRRAAAYLRRERPGHTLRPTDLVHEAYLRLDTALEELASQDERQVRLVELRFFGGLKIEEAPGSSESLWPPPTASGRTRRRGSTGDSSRELRPLPAPRRLGPIGPLR